MPIRILILALLAPLLFAAATLAAASYQEQRQTMLQRDIAGRGIRDPQVLAAMAKIPRHLLVAERYRHEAYADHPLPIDEGQTISQPYVVALMSEALHLRPSDRVLEIGTGSGYQAAVLAEIVREVRSIHRDPAKPGADRGNQTEGARFLPNS